MISWVTAVIFAVFAVLLIGALDAHQDMEDRLTKANQKLTLSEQKLCHANDELKKTRQQLQDTKTELTTFLQRSEQQLQTDKAHITAKNQEMNEMQIHITNKANELRDMTRKITSLKEDLEDANQYARFLQDELDEQCDEYDEDMKHELEQKDEVIMELETEIEDKEAVIRSWERNNANTIRALQGQIVELERKIQADVRDRASAEEVLGQLEEGVGMLEKENAQLKAENAQFKEETEQINDAAKRTGHTADELLSAIQAQHLKATELDLQRPTQFVTLTTQLENAKKENEQLEKENAQFEEEIKQMEDANRKLRNENGHMEDANSQQAYCYSKDFRAVQDQRSTMLELYWQTQDQVLALTAQLDKVQAKNAELGQENAQLKENDNNVCEAVRASELGYHKAAEKTQMQVISLSMQLDNVKQENSELEQLNAQLRDATMFMEVNVSETHRALRVTQSRLTDAGKLNELLQEKVRRREAEKAGLEQENGILAQDLGTHVRRVEEMEKREREGDAEWPEDEDEGDEWKEGMRSVVFGAAEEMSFGVVDKWFGDEDMWVSACDEPALFAEAATGSETEIESESESGADDCEFPESESEDEGEHIEVVEKEVVEKEMQWVEGEKEWVEAESEGGW
jgi:chromosome segregation ATPase